MSSKNTRFLLESQDFADRKSENQARQKWARRKLNTPKMGHANNGHAENEARQKWARRKLSTPKMSTSKIKHAKNGHAEN